MASSQESLTPDQRLDLLLAEHEQKQRDDAAAAALSRIRSGDYSGVHASREGVHPQSCTPKQQQEQASSSMQRNQCHPNGRASSFLHTNQCHPNGQAGSLLVHAMTQCRPSGQAGQTIVANNSVPFDSVPLLDATFGSVSSLNANAQACRPNGQAECRPNGQAIQWRKLATTMHGTSRH